MKFETGDWIALFALGVSIIALLLTLMQMWTNRIRITHTMSANIVVHDAADVFYRDIAGNPQILFDRQCNWIRLDIVNSTPHAISYFDLRAFPPKTNLNYYLMTRRSVPQLENLNVYLQDTKDEYHLLDIPDKTHGAIPANGFVSYDLIVMSRDSTPISDCIISFRIPKRRLFGRDRFSVTNRGKFVTYGTRYHNLVNQKNEL